MSLLKLHSFWCCMESQNEDNQLQKKVVLDKNYISWEKNMLKAIWAIFTSYSRIDCSNYELGSIFELNTLKFENYSSELNCCIAAPILNQTSCCSLKYFFFVTIRIIWEIFFLGKKLDLVRKLMMKFKTFKNSSRIIYIWPKIQLHNANNFWVIGTYDTDHAIIT